MIPADGPLRRRVEARGESGRSSGLTLLRGMAILPGLRSAPASVGRVVTMAVDVAPRNPHRAVSPPFCGLALPVLGSASRMPGPLSDHFTTHNDRM